MRRTRSSQTFSLEAKDFYSDLSDSDMLYAALVRSPAGNGTLKSISIQTDDPEYKLFTAQDVPGKNKITINGTDIQIFCKDVVSYPGEVLGIVTGPDKKTVYELAAKANINFDIDSLESAFHTIEKKYKAPLTNISQSINENQAGEDFSELVNTLNELPSLDSVQTTKKADKIIEPVTKAQREVKTGLFQQLPFEEAEYQLTHKTVRRIQETEDESETEKYTEEIISEPYIFEGQWKLEQVDSLWQETNGAFCEKTKSMMHVYTTTRWSWILLEILKQSLGLDAEKICIHKTKNTGMYANGMWKNARTAAQTAIASFLTEKPVKLIYTQSEQERYMKPGVDTTISYKTVMEESCKIKAMIIHINADIGSDNPFADEILDRMTIASTGLYQIENLYISAKAVTSSNPPTSVYPRIIDSQSFFALENHIQQIAKGMHLLPTELREKNLQDNKTAYPFNIKTGNIPEAMSCVVNQSDFNRKFITFRRNADSKIHAHHDSFFALPLRGIGMSLAYTGSGYLGHSLVSGNQKMEVTLRSDDILEIHAMKPSAVVEEIWKKTVYDTLQIESSKIKINAEYQTDQVPNMSEESSSNITVMTYLLKKCCLEIQKKRFRERLPISSKKQFTPSMKNKWNNTGFYGVPFFQTSLASAVVEVEMDSYTYSEKIKGIWLCVDCGEIFDEKAAEKAIRLAIQQELTTLVENERVSCDAYHISFIHSKNSPGQLGDLVHNTIPAAFSAALSLALSTEITNLPVSQTLLYELIKENESIEEEKESVPENLQTEEQQKSDMEFSQAESTDSEISDNYKRGEL